MTLEEHWYLEPGNRKALGDLLETPWFRDAISLLMEKGLPSNVYPQGADPVQWSALQHASDAGYFRFLRGLRNLAEPPKQKTETLTPFKR